MSHRNSEDRYVSRTAAKS